MYPYHYNLPQKDLWQINWEMILLQKYFGFANIVEHHLKDIAFKMLIKTASAHLAG